MTEADLRQIEARLGFPLPGAFRATALNYPFPADSFADEFMLPSRSNELVEMNATGVPIAGIGRPFFIGSDGGEERYLLTHPRRNLQFMFTNSRRDVTAFWLTPGASTWTTFATRSLKSRQTKIGKSSASS